MNPTIEPTIPKPSPRVSSPRWAQADLDCERVVLRNYLRLYIRRAWPVVEPSTVYLENWHIDLIAEYLEAVTAGQIKRLLIIIRKIDVHIDLGLDPRAVYG